MTVSLPGGTILHKTYRIIDIIGQGGFGITYKALNVFLNKQVCIKELFISGSSTRGANNTVQSQDLKEYSFDYFKKGFIDEARELSKLNHSGIVRVIDGFEENGTAYYVMDFIEGETLKSIVTSEGRLTPQKALPIMNGLMQAVQYVHEFGMLHRDIKPENVLISEKGNVVLIDFGSARPFEEGKTVAQTVLITPGYAPPEQYELKAKRGAFTDIYSLGATLYFLLTGQKPIPVPLRHNETIQAPHQIFSDIPKTTSSAVMLALNLKPEERFQTIEDMRDALQKTDQPEIPAKILDKNEWIHTFKWTSIIFMFAFTSVLLYNFFETRRKNQILAEEKQIRDSTKVADSLARVRAKETAIKVPDSMTNNLEGVKIGNQIWATRNLDVSTFRNGDPIPEAKTAEKWKDIGNKGKPAWCYYGNETSNGRKYGKLYNWFAVNDPRGLAPKGWHIPSDSEWTLLSNYYSGRLVAGQKIKSTYGWSSLNGKNGNGDNTSGFEGLPGGEMGSGGNFSGLCNFGEWWTSTQINDYAWFRSITNQSGTINRNNASKKYGMSVRCIKD